MVANPAKFQVMFMGSKEPVEKFLINDILIPVTDSVKLLGIIIDKKLNFKCHTEELCKKATNKTKALFRPYITLFIQNIMNIFKKVEWLKDLGTKFQTVISPTNRCLWMRDFLRFVNN